MRGRLFRGERGVPAAGRFSSKNLCASVSICGFNDAVTMSKKSPVSRSGRFASGPAADVAQFTESISFDHRLWKQDILGSIAHASMLAKIGILSERERDDIVEGLTKIGEEIQSGAFQWNPDLEDVH